MVNFWNIFVRMLEVKNLVILSWQNYKKCFNIFGYEMKFHTESSIVPTEVVYRALRTQANLLDLLMERYTDLRELKMLDMNFIHYFHTNMIELGASLQGSE